MSGSVATMVATNVDHCLRPVSSKKTATKHFASHQPAQELRCSLFRDVNWFAVTGQKAPKKAPAENLRDDD